MNSDKDTELLLTEDQDIVLGFFLSGESWTARDVAGVVLQCSRKKATRVLRSLQKNQLVESEEIGGQRLWSITHQGYCLYRQLRRFYGQDTKE